MSMSIANQYLDHVPNQMYSLVALTFSAVRMLSVNSLFLSLSIFPSQYHGTASQQFKLELTKIITHPLILMVTPLIPTQIQRQPSKSVAEVSPPSLNVKGEGNTKSSNYPLEGNKDGHPNSPAGVGFGPSPNPSPRSVWKRIFITLLKWVYLISTTALIIHITPKSEDRFAQPKGLARYICLIVIYHSVCYVIWGLSQLPLLSGT